MSSSTGSFVFGRLTSWLFAVGAIALIGIWLFKVNQPAAFENEASAFKATEGSIIEGRHDIPGREYLAVRMDFNKRVNLKGRFRSVDKARPINCVVIAYGNLEPWRQGKNYQRVAETGIVPGGRIDRVVEPGTYFSIFDNRMSDRDAILDADFWVD